MIDELSNAFSRFSLPRLGAELDRGGGASRRLPPADHATFGAPARRGFKTLKPFVGHGTFYPGHGRFCHNAWAT